MIRHLSHLVIGTSALGLAIGGAGAAIAQTEAARPDAAVTRDADARADAIVGRMTLDEKIAMLHGTFGSAILKERPSEKRNGAGHVPGVPRLGVPDLFESDASLGVANGGQMRKGDVATALPSSLMTAASFDPSIAYAGGAMIGAESRAKGFNVLLAGGANLVRDARNGRNFEYLSEDVLLTGRMAGESIRGIQSNDIVSTIKHYALNAQETGRNVLDARMPEAAMRESDLLAFQMAIEIGRPGSVMCGYNQVNGAYACENAFLLNDVLKRDWGYTGWVMSDWGAVHSTARATTAGLDQESGQELDRQVFFGAPLKAAVTSGQVSTARLDDMVRRIVRTMIAHRLLDNPTPSEPQSIDYRAHADVSQRAAEAGMVLLKNDRGVLPAAATARRILLVGAHADIGVLSGGGSSQVRPASGVALELPMPGGGPLSGFIKITYHASSPLAAMRARAPNAEVTYLDGSDAAAAAAAAKRADLVVVFAQQWRSEAVDVESLKLPGGQDDLISAVGAANPRTVVVLETGGAVSMPWIDRVAAVLAAWYPGERGGQAITRVLFGDVNPSGRLPITFPASDVQGPRPDVPGLGLVRSAAAEAARKPVNPDISTVDLTGGVPTFPVEYPEGADAGYRWFQATRAKPLFPFGHGLSYTTFSYGGIRVAGGDVPQVTFTVTNTGRVPGADVPQVYATRPGFNGAPVRRLVGFEKVTLAPGESRTVQVDVDPRLIADYDPGRRSWHVHAGAVPISVGHSVDDIDLSGTASVNDRLWTQ
ncbi:beta-glucosidase family protein [Sphingomonas sp. CLY1604]|uniref:beta-glucosidase family protein n=1 Tax=Sphingomonas sp. CLY1604 TaxID=3457786 RepID=UPI003FD8EF4B